MSSRLGTRPFPKESGNYPPSPARGNQRKTPERSSLELAAGRTKSSRRDDGAGAPSPVPSLRFCQRVSAWEMKKPNYRVYFWLCLGSEFLLFPTYLLFQPLGLVSVFRTFSRHLCLHESVPLHRSLLTLCFFSPELISRPFLSGLS